MTETKGDGGQETDHIHNATDISLMVAWTFKMIE